MAAKTKTKQERDETMEGRSLCCSLPEVQERDLSHISDGHRVRLIALMAKMWVNGTNLTYFFFKEPAHWRGGSDQEQAVRDAFATWKELGISLTFHPFFQINKTGWCYWPIILCKNSISQGF